MLFVLLWVVVYFLMAVVNWLLPIAVGTLLFVLLYQLAVHAMAEEG